ncbi:Uncharacterized protein HZ326_0446 [Fusarium oxysporum f. sp. albedinis]|nr:Uncharacterized protein HZ326_0446 [Fusarium oxysporum f. sp. albedinis]
MRQVSLVVTAPDSKKQSCHSQYHNMRTNIAPCRHGSGSKVAKDQLCSSLTKYKLRGHTQITQYTTLFCQTGTQRKAVTVASPVE